MTKDGPEAPSEGGEEKKELIAYPSVYTFKVMGVQEQGFAEYVRQLFSRLMGTDISPDSMQEQPSSKGKYVSVTVSVYLLSEEHRRAIYTQLHQEKRIVYYL
ncbi:DUF493 domain-containing protein [Stigmatella sp. ncwal1]|uniref:DUF493 domain-containing protein n=1 Tax=Stigmatella ashevillensis TaxID=2995309 RepID=A0ABT5D165_9BACT|nr:DUF493 domain-containing protein [Stigmatella ashevillena]MDC0707412.1 DUF493 domain-containing protein [Stigmatella ashevillena]